MGKAKIAFYWCASCGGCEEAVVDLAEDILAIVEKAEIVFWVTSNEQQNDQLRWMSREPCR